MCGMHGRNIEFSVRCYLCIYVISNQRGRALRHTSAAYELRRAQVILVSGFNGQRGWESPDSFSGVECLMFYAKINVVGGRQKTLITTCYARA